MAAMAGVMWRSRLRLSLHIGVRALLTLAFAVAAARNGELLAGNVLAAGLLMLITLHEATVIRAYQHPIAAGLPELPTRPLPRFPQTVVVRVDIMLVLWFGLVSVLGWHGWWQLVPVLLWTAAVVIAYLVSAARGRAEAGVLDQVRASLDRLAPEFALHFSGPQDSIHQVQMWLPYLRRVGRPFVVIVRERHAFEALEHAGVPMVLCGSLTHLEALVTESLRSVFYVNNGMKNTHLVRFMHLTHVQLLHGDSDKPPSYSPVTAMFDKIFVAGQAGRDRYTQHGVEIPDDKFVIVGRPQVEAIGVGRRPDRDLTAPSVLYAPTWQGQYEDSNFCSLPFGRTIVSSLLDAGARVIFRPHPFSASNPTSAAQIAGIEALLAAHTAGGGPPHSFGEQATGPNIVDAFNAADALVADLSSVVTDFLFTGRPFAVTNIHDDPTFAERYPIVGAGYQVASDGQSLSTVWTDMLGEDSLSAARRDIRTYYLGPFAAEGYAGAFVDAVRDLLDTTIVGQTEHAEEVPAGSGLRRDPRPDPED